VPQKEALDSIRASVGNENMVKHMLTTEAYYAGSS